MTPHDTHIDFTEVHSDRNFHPGEKELEADPGQGENADRKDRDSSETATGAEISQESRKFRVRELLDGTILVRENMIRQLPYVIFLTVLGVIYIGNRYHAEYMVRRISELKTEVDNLRAEQITTTSELMNISRPSEVAALVKSRNLGLKESLEPPKKLRRR